MLDNLKIGRKLAAVFGVISVVVIACSLVSYSKLTDIETAALANRLAVRKEASLTTVMTNLLEQQNAMRGYAASANSEFVEKVKSARANVRDAFSSLQDLLDSDRSRNLNTANAEFEKGVDDVMAKVADPASLDAARSEIGSVARLTHIREIMTSIRGEEAKARAERNAAQDAAFARGKATLAIGGLLTLLASVAFGTLLHLSLGRPVAALTTVMHRLSGGDKTVEIAGVLRRDEIGAMAKAVQVFKTAAIEKERLEVEAEASRAAQAQSRDRQAAIDSARAEDLKMFVHAVEAGFDRLSQGDLTVRMHQLVAPEFEPIKLKFNDSVEALEGTIGSVVGAVGSMRVGLNQITIAAGDLSQRTEQQAASLEETVAALSQIVQGVNLTAQSAEDAQTAATLAQAEAEKGGGVVAQAVSAMAEIEQSSEKIGRIIGVIDEIAFQTNLLALNAGVEAARAGEAGRGFAVVAQEVRGLAQRSAEAAKEIKDLISISSTQVEHGVEFVSASGRSLEQIVAQVGGVTAMISQMAQGAREQSVALKEVSIAADQMDKVTQQNAAMVEETTAAAQSLSTETEQLAALVDGFRTGGSKPGATRTPSERIVRTLNAPTNPQRPVPQMRTIGIGSAAPKAQVAKDEWAEF